ncbi:MAG: response regulator [Desulfuromonadales bacterium]|nr:response regulator [Desulfuromonadales bacterium]
MTRHVVIIDDSDIDLKVLSAAIDACGMRASVFCNGIDANEVLFGEAVDLIILDVEMPFVHGTVKARILKEHPDTKDIPLLLISGKSAAEMQTLSEECGADGYITKPISRQHLCNTLRQFFADDQAASDNATSC